MKQYTHVYIDESGEIGRKSKCLVFASIETTNPRHLEKVIKKIWRVKPQFHVHGELHANVTDEATKTRVVATINELDVHIRYTVIVKSHQKKRLDLVYYEALALFIAEHPNAHVVVVDRKDTNKKRRSIIIQLGLEGLFSNVQFEESHKVKQLQAVDFVAWAIGRFYETADDTYMNLLSNLEEIKTK